jgi:hypothetical protein
MMQHSAHFLECKNIVEGKYPQAKIVETKKGELWKLVSGETDISLEHNAHYLCYAEARRNIEAK